jgi:hypothetical protein
MKWFDEMVFAEMFFDKIVFFDEMVFHKIILDEMIFHLKKWNRKKIRGQLS